MQNQTIISFSFQMMWDVGLFVTSWDIWKVSWLCCPANPTIYQIFDNWSNYLMKKNLFNTIDDCSVPNKNILITGTRASKPIEFHHGWFFCFWANWIVGIKFKNKEYRRCIDYTFYKTLCWMTSSYRASHLNLYM